MGKIYIASKAVTGGEIGGTANREHLYLVYAPHDVVDRTALVIRGGPVKPMGWVGPVEADHGNIFIDAGKPLVDSADNFFDTAGETPVTIAGRSGVYFDMDNDGFKDWKTGSPHGGGDDEECEIWLRTYSNDNAEFGKSQAA